MLFHLFAYKHRHLIVILHILSVQLAIHVLSKVRPRATYNGIAGSTGLPGTALQTSVDKGS